MTSSKATLSRRYAKYSRGKRYSERRRENSTQLLHVQDASYFCLRMKGHCYLTKQIHFLMMQAINLIYIKSMLKNERGDHRHLVIQNLKIIKVQSSKQTAGQNIPALPANW